MPATLRVSSPTEPAATSVFPAETWIRTAATDVPVVGNSPVVRAVIDPDHKVPDKDRSNNDLALH